MKEKLLILFGIVLLLLVTDTPEATSTPEDSSKDDSEAKTTPTPAPKTTLKLAKD